MLTKPIIVCVNRGGRSLETARQVVESVGWPVIGVDPCDLVLADAGNAIVGFGFQIVSLTAVQTGGACCPEFTEAVASGASLGSVLELAATLEADIVRAARHRDVDEAAAPRKKIGEHGRNRAMWTDINGNLVSFVEFEAAGLRGKRGKSYRRILDRRGFAPGRPVSLDNPSPLLGVTLLVTDLDRSRRFYEEVVGLPVVVAEDGDVTLDAGTIVLRLRPEPVAGLVRDYHMNGMLRDQISFYTPDIEAEYQNLAFRGAVFPRGIQRSVSAGALAKFVDPDGYALWLWESQPGFLPGMPIDYFPVLTRILREQGVPLPTASTRVEAVGARGRRRVLAGS